MVLGKMEKLYLYLEKVSGLIKTDTLTSKVLAEGLKTIVKLEGIDEKKEPYEKTKKKIGIEVDTKPEEVTEENVAPPSQEKSSDENISSNEEPKKEQEKIKES